MAWEASEVSWIGMQCDETVSTVCIHASDECCVLIDNPCCWFTLKALLDVTGHPRLLANNAILRRLLEMRDPYIEPLHILQARGRFSAIGNPNRVTAMPAF